MADRTTGAYPPVDGSSADYAPGAEVVTESKPRQSRIRRSEPQMSVGQGLAWLGFWLGLGIWLGCDTLAKALS